MAAGADAPPRAELPFMLVKALPLFPTLKGYHRAWLAPDLIAGLTLVAIAIPEQMATAHLANMPAVTGFFAFVAGSVVFALLGRHPVLSVGADSTIAPVFAAGVASVAAVGAPAYSALVSATALFVGVVLVVVGLLRLGWVADFFPLPVVLGLLAGIGAEIVVKQLPTVLGLAGGGTTTIGRLEKVVDELHGFNGWSLAIAAGVLVIVLVAEKVDRRVPGALIGVVGATVLVGVAGLSAHGVHVVGAVHAALPKFALPSAGARQLGRLTVTAVTVAFLCIVQTSATTRSAPAALRSRTRPGDFDVDLIALGLGNAVAGLAGAFPVDASPPRTAVVGSAGGRTQVAGLTAAAAVVIVVAFATSLLRDLPEAALGAILLFVASRLFRFSELVSIARFSWFEMALSFITFAVVVLVGVEQGVVAAALVALAQRGRAEARPRDGVMGRQPGTDHWMDTSVGRPTEQVPGTLVYLLYAPLWYGNAAHVCDRARALALAAGPLKAFVLNANGISDIDYTGAKALGELIEDLKRAGTRFGVARASHLVHHDFEHAGLLDTIGTASVFDDVEDAVRALAG